MKNLAKWRLLDLYTNSYPEASSGISQAITRARSEGIVPDTLVLATFRRPGVLMGIFHSPENDVNLEYAKENKIVVVRAPFQGLIFGHTGYMGVWSYASKAFFPETIPEVFKQINEMVAKGLDTKYSTTSRHRPLNDLETLVGTTWKKIGPHGAYFQDDLCIDRLNLSVTPVPLDVAEKVLSYPKEKFSDKAAKSVSERIGSISEAVGKPVSMDEIKELLINCFSESLGIELERGFLTDKEMEYERAIFEKNTSPEWFYARSEQKVFKEIAPNGKIGEGLKKVPEGPMIRVSICVDQGILKGIIFSGTFFPMVEGKSAPDAIEALEESLIGLNADPDNMKKAMEENWERLGIEVVEGSLEDFSEIVLKAISRL